MNAARGTVNVSACCRCAFKREEIDEIYAYDICACVGLKSVNTGDTLRRKQADHSRIY
jgi:translation elongation factor EF-G